MLLFAALLALAAPLAVLDVRGSIDPGTADYVVEAIHAAEAAGTPVLIRLDTPGGLVESTRDIVQAELGATVPVIVWVEPSGARAGSAGTFIVAAAHVAVMAPGTTIGAAHPVSLTGGEGDEAVSDKAVEDVAAWSRAIAERRGRDADWLERTVRESVAATDSEALALGVADLIAADLPALLAAADGREVELPSGRITLDLAGAEPFPVDMTTRQRVLHALGDPNVLFLLVMVAGLGLWIELNNPGLVLPGLLGVAALIAAGIGMSIVPFHAGGLALLAVGFALVAAEVWVGASGVLLLAGLGAVIAGGLLLFDVPGNLGVRVDLGSLLIVAAVLGGVGLLFAAKVTRAQRRRPLTGSEALIGAEGEVVSGGDGHGAVRVGGEEWTARWAGPLATGASVRVTRVDGLVLEVEALEEVPWASSPGSSPLPS